MWSVVECVVCAAAWVHAACRMLATHPHGAPQPWVRHRWAVPFACTLALSIRPHQRPSPVTSHSLLSCLPPFLLHPPSPSRSLSRPTSFSTTRVLRSDTPTTQHLPVSSLLLPSETPTFCKPVPRPVPRLHSSLFISCASGYDQPPTRPIQDSQE